MKLSFIILFKIEFLLPFTSCKKVLGKMPGKGNKLQFVYVILSKGTSTQEETYSSINYLKTFCKDFYQKHQNITDTHQNFPLAFLGKKALYLAIFHCCDYRKYDGEQLQLHKMIYSRKIQTGIQVGSQEHCTNQVTITLMTTLLPNQVTLIFPLREIVRRSFLHFAFNLLKTFTKF